MLARIVRENLADLNVTPFFASPETPQTNGANPAENFEFLEAGETGSHEIFSAVSPNNFPSPDEILQQARDEAAQIIANAEAWSAAIEEAAKERAKAEVRAELAAESAAQVADLRENLAQTLAEISRLKEEITGQAEQQLVELALEIAKKIVGREVSFDREIAFTLAKVSLSRLQSHAAARVHLSSEDFAFVDLHRERLNFHGALELVEDRSIAPGGCLVRTENGDIDARLESQFDQIAQGLLGKV